MSPAESWPWVQEQQMSAQEKLQKLKDTERWLDDQALWLLDNLISNFNGVDSKLKDMSSNMTEAQKNDLTELYNWFQQEVISYWNDVFLDNNELWRMNAINNQLNVILNEDNFEKWWKEWWNEWLEEFKSVSDLVKSREVLKWIEWAENLYSLLNMIDTLWEENISDTAILDKYVSDIFWDKKIDSSDVANLKILNKRLLFVYDASTLRNKNESDGSLENKESKSMSARDIIDLVEWAKGMIPDWLDKRAPAFWEFFDNISKQVRDSVTDDSLMINNLWWALSWIVEWFKELTDTSLTVDNVMEKAWSLMSTWFNLINWVRHLIPSALQTLCKWIKQLKDYYIKTSWSNEEHWVIVQWIDEVTENMKGKWYCPDKLADKVSGEIKTTLALANGVTDAVLDFIGWAADVVLTPEVAVSNFKGMVWDISMEPIMKMLWEPKDMSMFIKLTQFIAYLGTMIGLWMSTWINMLNKVQEFAGKIVKMFWKPAEMIGNLIKNISWSVKKVAWLTDFSIWSLVAKIDNLTPDIEIRWIISDVVKKAWQEIANLDEKLKFVDMKSLVEKFKTWDVIWAIDDLNNVTTKYWSAAAPLNA